MYLLTFSEDWADEFQVEGFAIFSQEQLTALKAAVEALDPNWCDEFYFGSNEEIMLSKNKVHTIIFSFKEITEEQVETLKLVPQGHFPNLLEMLEVPYYVD